MIAEGAVPSAPARRRGERSMKRVAALAAALAAISLGACAGGDAETEWPVAKEPLSIAEVAWNPSKFDVGRIEAVTEDDTDVIVFGTKGAAVFAGGAIAAVDNSVTAWRAASLLPAAEGAGLWPAGVDMSGRVHRVRARSTLEAISDRYGLAQDAAKSALALGESWAAFVLDASIAVADGRSVVRYDVEATNGASGGAKRVAAIGASGRVLVLDVAKETLTTFTVPGAIATAIDAQGGVYVATADAIYEQGGDGPAVVHRAEGARLHGLVASGDRIWFGEGTKLGALAGRAVSLSQAEILANDATLLTSPSGAVWSLSNGALARFEVPATGDEGVWQATVRPIYAHTCSACHARHGTAGIDLSTYDAWVQRRARIYDRVVVRKDMPQGGTLPDADVGAVAAWAAPN
jgi:hypothetical protein